MVWTNCLECVNLYMDYINDILMYRAVVQIYARPNFLLEFIFGLFYLFLTLYLNDTIGLKLQELKCCKERPVEQVLAPKHTSRESICTSVTHHQVHQDYYFYKPVPSYMQKDLLKTWSRTTQNIGWSIGDQSSRLYKPIVAHQKSSSQNMLMERLASLTPSQFVKIDKKHQKRKRQLSNCMTSLTTLLDNIIQRKYSTNKIKQQLNDAKEDALIQSSNISNSLMNYMDAENVTDSLINILNKIVEDVTESEKMPMRAELTTILYDIGNLSKTTSLIMDTQCKLIHSNDTFSTITKDSREEDEKSDSILSVIK